MKLLKLLLITFFFSITLDAAYLRTIRVGSFTTADRAQLELTKLNKFALKHQNIIDLKDKWGFEFKYRKSGTYYITIIEPLRDKDVLQTLLDTLRLKYPDVYVTKLKQLPIVEKKTEVVVENIIEVIPEVKVIEVQKPIEVLKETPKKEIVVIKEEPVQEKATISLIKETPITTNKDEENESLFQVLFYVTLALFFITLLLLILSRKSYKKQKVKEQSIAIENSEKCDSFSSQMQNNENFLADAQASISTIISYTNLLLEFDLSVIQKDYTKRIKNSSENLLNTVNNSSDISRIKLGELQINNLDFNIKSMINDLSNIISLESRENNVNLSMHFDEDIPEYVVGDSTHLRQVLVSLLTNSIRYTRDGEVTLRVKKVYSYKHAITLGFVVSDTGLGMTPQQVESIMNPRKSTISTNLGVSKQLVEMMNGNMKIYSTQDVGTTFTFNIKFELKQ